ncbi:lipase family protein [Flammeovirga agarivorans]|uniref:Fungal lipase-type domain-containing protein n=1 Tax=Flammeovirga agarivorans TaxID=2726742 RepID=A0A7X8SPJ5_9BACT|nr:lipase family protein [Flammeovirga agarivorans]NLR94033.1 hypothetical protein [Flammeovirga agarivorans]
MKFNDHISHFDNKYTTSGIECYVKTEEQKLVIEVHPSKSIFPLFVTRLKYQKSDGFHKGYLKSFNAIKAQFDVDFHYKISQYNDIQITGFSIGGAISQIFALYLYNEFNIKSTVITYDSPTPFNTKRRNEFDAAVLHQEHYVFGIDIFGDFPLKLFGYEFPKNQKDYKFV